jgi:L-amino acid N-acyltransferase
MDPANHHCAEKGVCLLFTLREAQLEDVPDLLAIYNAAILTSPATFDLEPQTLEQRTEWFLAHGERYPILVAVDEEAVLGYACLSPFREKPAYGKTVETSVYVHPNAHRRGVGTALVSAILDRAKELGYHTVIAGITAGNEASERLHQQFGFEKVGTLREVGYKFHQWHDVHFYQLMLSENA